METVNVAYVAIRETDNEMFVGSRGQVAFSTKGALKNSMNNINRSYDNRKGKYNYKDPEWIFYEIDPIGKKLVQVVK